jgi:hypothetical protein
VHINAEGFIVNRPSGEHISPSPMMQPAVPFEAMQRRIKRARFHLQQIYPDILSR